MINRKETGIEEGFLGRHNSAKDTGLRKSGNFLAVMQGIRFQASSSIVSSASRRNHRTMHQPRSVPVPLTDRQLADIQGTNTTGDLAHSSDPVFGLKWRGPQTRGNAKSFFPPCSGAANGRLDGRAFILATCQPAPLP